MGGGIADNDNANSDINGTSSGGTPFVELKQGVPWLCPKNELLKHGEVGLGTELRC